MIREIIKELKTFKNNFKLSGIKSSNKICLYKTKYFHTNSRFTSFSGIRLNTISFSQININTHVNTHMLTHTRTHAHTHTDKLITVPYHNKENASKHCIPFT